MRIKAGFHLDLVVGALLILSAVLAFVLIQLRLEAAVVEKEALDRAVNQGMELVQSTGEVLLYGEPRAIEQWRDQAERLARAFALLNPPADPRGRDILAGLATVLAEMPPLFERLATLPDGSRSDALLSSQLFRKSVQMQAQLRALNSFAEKDLEWRYTDSKALMLYTFGAFLAALAAFGAFVSYKFRNNLLRPIDELRAVIDEINTGERTRRARVFAHDEIGVVARTLNALLDQEAKSRQELQDAADLFRATFEQAAVGIARVGLDGRLLQANGKLSYIVGRGPHELVGESLAPLFHDGDRDADRALLAELLAGKRATYAIEKRLARAAEDGNVLWVNQTVALARDAAGVPQYFIHVFEDISSRKRAEGQAEFLAYHDVLTGLPNQQLVRARLDQALAHADRSGERIALIFIDLDNFKSINDSLGHPIGDALLKVVAERLLGCVRDTDMVSRKGGDEFLVVLTEVGEVDDVGPVADKLLERLAAPIEIGGHELSTTASVGIAIYPDDSRDFDTLLKKADTAMYQAKAAGRNAYRFFAERMNVEASEYLQLRNGLRRALEAGEFALHYQPQVDLATDRVFGVEALLRWSGPLGSIPPTRFIPVAEDSGLIVPIGGWVIREACRQIAAWDAAGLPALTVAVNLSAVQFRRVDLEETVVAALEEFGVPPHRLELELTESTLIQDTEDVIVTLGRLKALGVSLSIDDFGTGYSSLAYLKRFNVDRLKIDQSFVRGLSADLEYVPIVRAIIQLARSFDLKTVAEGVEDGKILERLRLLGCDEAQGYHIAKPLPPRELEDFLSQRRRQAA